MRVIFTGLGLVIAACGPIVTTAAPRFSQVVSASPAVDVRYDGEEMLHTPVPIPTRTRANLWEDAPGLDVDEAAWHRLIFNGLGAPDPRGLELRHVTIRGNAITGEMPVSVETLGFLIPGEPLEGRRFVIAPDGLVYAAERLGDVAQDDEALMTHGVGWVLWATLRRRAGLPELLERTDPDESHHHRVERQRDESRGHVRPRFGTIYERTDWLWAHVRRAMSARMSGDDALALFDLRRADDLLEYRNGFFHAHNSTTREPGSWHAGLIRPLRADQERRMASASNGPPLEPVEPSLAGLVLSLDDIVLEAGTRLSSNNTVHALVERGAAAVPTLLTALESDHRLMREVRGMQGFRDHWHPRPVREAVYAVLQQITQAWFLRRPAPRFTDLSTTDTQALVARIRAYWARYGTMSNSERWVAVLNDDEAEPEAWAQAATRNAGLRRSGIGGTLFAEFFLSRRVPVASEQPTEHRETQTESSITPLLARRFAHLMAQAAAAPPSDLGTRSDFDQRFARSTGALDQRASLLEHACGIAGVLAQTAETEAQRILAPHLDSCIALECSCTLAMFDLLSNQRNTVQRYMRWLEMQTPTQNTIVRLLRPALNWPTHRRLQRFLRRLLESREWTDVVLAATSVQLVSYPAARRILLLGLHDRLRLAQIEIVEGHISRGDAPYLCSSEDRCWAPGDGCEGACSERIGGGICRTGDLCSAKILTTACGDDCPAEGTATEVRAQDELAQRLYAALATHTGYRQMHVVHQFRHYYTRAEKNRLIAALIEWLESGGSLDELNPSLWATDPDALGLG